MRERKWQKLVACVLKCVNDHVKGSLKPDIYRSGA